MTENVTDSSAPIVPTPIAGGEHAVVHELHQQFGADTFVFQATLDNVPTLWVPSSPLRHAV